MLSKFSAIMRAPWLVEVGDQAGDLAGAVVGALQRLVEQLGEAGEPRLQVLRLVVERGDHAGERLVERAGEAADAQSRRPAALVSRLLTSVSSDSLRSLSEPSVRRLLRSISATASASERPCESNWVASCDRSVSVSVVTVRNALMCCSTCVLAVPVFAATSFMAVTNSATRFTSVLSISFMFSCAPLSTSCRRMLASRRRSNRAVVSDRSMPWVSSISETAVCGGRLRRLDGGVGLLVQVAQRLGDRGRGALGGGVGAVLQLLERAGDRRGGAFGRQLGGGVGLLHRAGQRVGRVLARLVDQAGDVLGVVHHRLREGEALGFDRLHRMLGDAADFARELLALAGRAR